MYDTDAMAWIVLMHCIHTLWLPLIWFCFIRVCNISMYLLHVYSIQLLLSLTRDSWQKKEGSWWLSREETAAKDLSGCYVYIFCIF